jgi:hypothetical protein
MSRVVWHPGRVWSIRTLSSSETHCHGLAQRLSLGPTPGGGREKVRLIFLSAPQGSFLSAIGGGAGSSTRVLLSIPRLARICTAGNTRYSAGRLGGVSSRTPLRAPHLAESLITGHLDPLCAFGNGFSLVACCGLIRWFVHRLVVPGRWHARPWPPRGLLQKYPREIPR